MYLRGCATKFRLKLNLYCISLQIKHPVSVLRCDCLAYWAKCQIFKNFPGKDLGVSFTPGRQRNPPGYENPAKCTDKYIASS